jgi:2,4-dienoyl-CoA reductase-like NADH-dependent reductase (Old Yellow Enzyme family)
VPRGASGYLPGTRDINVSEIEELVQSFVNAAKRAVRIGCDGLMVHCAHGYGLSQFLSPFSNRRVDRYGGSPENRLRIVVEIVREVRKVVPDRFPILCKINGHDGLENGVTPEICAKNVQVLSKEGVGLFEISTGFQNVMVLSRSELCEGRTVRGGSEEEIGRWKGFLRGINPEFPFSYGYTARYADVVRRFNAGVPLAIVGGNRRFSDMENLVASGKSEFVSIARPLIRDPNLINRFKNGQLEVAECRSCNQCFVRSPASCLFPDP